MVKFAGNVTVPETKDHTPVSLEAGVLANKLKASLLQFRWATPAFETVVAGSLIKTTSSNESIQGPLAIVQRRVTLLPTCKPVTVLVGLDGVVITAPLASPNIVQVPVPIAAVFPLSVKVPV